jgi:hypothetical protein
MHINEDRISVHYLVPTANTICIVKAKRSKL